MFYLVEPCLYRLYKIGTAIYFYSPRWPYAVNVGISLDFEPAQLVDLVDHRQPGGPATVTSKLAWESTGLENIEHTLVVSVYDGETYAVVDRLMSGFFHKLFLSLPLTLGAVTPRAPPHP